MNKIAAVVVVSSLVLAPPRGPPMPRRSFPRNARSSPREPGDTPKADLAKEHYLLGVYAKENGLLDDARTEFRAALAADPSHEASHEALADVRSGEKWLAHDEAMTEKGLVLRDGKWLLREEAAILDLPAAEKARRVEEQAKVTKLLKTYGTSAGVARKYAADSLSGVDDKYKLDPLAWGLRSKNADVRVYSANETRPPEGPPRSAVRSSGARSTTPTRTVRSASLAAAKSIGDPNLLGAARQRDVVLERPGAHARRGGVGNAAVPIGVKYLVYRFEAHGGGAPRTYFSSINQISFIQDFDVEVAQTAFIADPIVGTIQEGVVLDAQVVATSAVGEFTEREVVYSALTRLTGATDVKNEPGAWAAWWKVHHAEYETAAR